MLSNKLQPIFKNKKSSNLWLYGVGTQHSFETSSSLSEAEKRKALDIKSARAYFSHDPMLFEMKKQQFDVGIGGLGRADAYLFRQLNIPYIRIAAEDVEAYTMQT